MKNLTILLITLLAFTSCKEEIKPLEFKTTTINSNFEADINVEFNKAIENSVIAKTINSHIETKILKTIPNAKNQITIESALKDFDNEFSTFKSDFPDDDQTWALSIETDLLYKSENIITISISVYSDTGGAHGNDSIQFLNFNPENGSLLSKKELISDIEGFKTLAQTYFLDQMKNESPDIEEFFYGKSFQLPENIGFNDKGVILLYNVYEIASFNQGYTEFTIPIEKAEEFLKFN